MDGSRIILAAHRGDRFTCPENTMSAFRRSVEFGVDMIETDIRETLDGELVLIHDRSALRTAGVDKNIDELTLKEVRELDAGSVFSEKFRGERIPTVSEFIEYMQGNDLLINWELKVYPDEFGDEAAFRVADKLIDMIEDAGLTSRSMINSFSDRVLEHVRKKHGDKFPIHGQGIFECKKTHDEAEMSENDLFDWCCLYPSRAGNCAIDCSENFKYCKEHGILPCICIPDVYDDYKRAVELGCRMFTSNNIYEAADILKKLGER